MSGEPRRPSRLGPYHLESRLGGGGQGVVYGGRDASGARVAIKTVLRPDASLLAAMRREVAALSRVRHPGILPVLASGEESGLPWYAMPVVEAPTLRQHRASLVVGASHDAVTAPIAGADDASPLSSAPDDAGGRRAVPLGAHALPGALSLVHKLCEILSYIHGEGVVHRDVKPENVLVRDGGLPLLVDFGLVTRYGGDLARETLHVEHGAVGTAAYVAPEQIMGARVDARADLYALGCLIYELVSGRPPYTGEPTSVLLGHLQRPARRLATVAPGIPGELDGLVARLLEKSPPRRIGHAADVASVLAGLGAQGFDDAGPRPRAYLYRAGIHGRASTLDAVGGLLEDACAGDGAVVLLEGKSGLGKTRLLHEAASLARERGMKLLSSGSAAAHDEGRAEAPLQALEGVLAAIADACREGGAVEVARVLGPHGGRGASRASVLAAYAPSIATLPGIGDLPPPPELTADAALARLHRALWETLCAHAGADGLAVLLDDLHWADDLTLAFLEQLVAAGWAGSSQILVLGTYRPEEARRRLRRLRPLLPTIEIDPLATPAVGAIMCDMLAIEAAPPRGLVETVAALAAGNPLFVAEYLRAAVDIGALARDAGGRWKLAGVAPSIAALPIPASLAGLLARRLADLDPLSRTIAECLAVLGREADPGVVAAVSGHPEAQVLLAAAELLARRVLDDEAPAPRLRIDHEELRVQLCAAVPEGRLRDLHRAAARALTQASPEHEGIPRHWELAGEPSLARDAYLDAARRSEARHALADAERCYRAALELPLPPVAATVEARLRLATLLGGPLAQTEAAAAQHRQGIVEARAIGDLPGSALHVGALGWLVGLGPEKQVAKGLLGVARALLAGSGNVPAEARVLSSLAGITAEQGRIDEALVIYQAALALHVRTGDDLRQVVAYANMATLCFGTGKTRQSEALVSRALELARAGGFRSHEGWLVRCLASIAGVQGQSLRSRRLLDQALAIDRETGHRSYEALTLSTLAQLHVERGELDDALRAAELALAIHRESGDGGYLAMALSDRGRIHEAQGRWDEAMADHRRAADVATATGSRRFQGGVLLGTARAALALGDLAAARLWVVEARELFDALGERRELAEALRDEARVARLAGRSSDAAEGAARAEALATEIEDLPERVKAACELGHAKLARGASKGAAACARRARKLLRSVAEPAPPLVRRIHLLERALEPGAELVRGELARELPPLLRERLGREGA